MVMLPHHVCLLLARVLADKQEISLARDAPCHSSAVTLDKFCSFIAAQRLQVARDHKGLPRQAVWMSSWHGLHHPK